MKTIFRYANIAVLSAAFIVLGSTAGFAQDPPKDPCTEPEQATARDKISTLFTDKTLAGRKSYVAEGKAFLERYGACESAKDMVDYLKPQLPKLEDTIKKMEADQKKAALLTPFDAALKAKNFDQVFSLGKQILAEYPDEFRTVEIVLASIGGDEAFFKANNKYADDALQFARQSIADLESGKSFVVGKETSYNVLGFGFKTKEDALGWLNLYIGYITNAVKKDKAGSLPYLFKATQSASESKTKPAPYALIGYYYLAEGDKLTDEIQALIADQKKEDTEEVAKQKVEAIKAKVALSNGVNERAIAAFAKAIPLITDAAYKADIKKALDFSYNRRFGKMEGLDAFVANAQKQAFVDPRTPVTPISDPDPTTEPATTTTTTTTAPTTTPAVKPTTSPVKPPTAPASKPSSTTIAKPAAAVRSQAKVKKVTKKKGA